MYKQSQVISLLLIFSIPFTMVSAETPQLPQITSMSEQILQQLHAILHFKSGSMPSLELNTKQVVEYSLIGSIALVILVVITSSARAKNKSSKPRLG